MAHKKYYGYKKPHEYYEVTFWADKGKEGTALYFIYEDGRCGMNKYYWGSDMKQTTFGMKRTRRNSCCVLAPIMERIW